MPNGFTKGDDAPAKKAVSMIGHVGKKTWQVASDSGQDKSKIQAPIRLKNNQFSNSGSTLKNEYVREEVH